MLTRLDILNLKAQCTPVQTSNGSVNIRQWSISEAASWQEFANRREKQTGKPAATETMIVRSLCDENGNLLFTDADADEVGSILVGFANELAEKITEANGLSKKQTEQSFAEKAKN